MSEALKEAVAATSSASVTYVASNEEEKSSKSVIRVENDALSDAKAPDTCVAAVSLAVLAEPDRVATELLIVWSVVVRLADSDAVAATSSASVTYVASKLLEKSSKLVTLPANDELSLAKAPLTEATIASLEVDAEADSAATEELIV